MAKNDDKKVTSTKADAKAENVDANAPADVKKVEKDGVTSLVNTETLKDRAEATETPAPKDNVRPIRDPNGGPKSTPETYEFEAKQKADAFDKRETYLDINDPAHANKTMAQLLDDAGEDVANMR
jgi:hypothetical protein